MSETGAPSRVMHRAILLSLSTGILVPAVGIITAPILAQAVGAAGRGEVAAAIAPNALIVSAATLGLPEALTWVTAHRPDLIRRGLSWATLFTLVLGVLAAGVIVLLLPVLSAGDNRLALLIFIGTLLALPMLAVNLLHAASVGQQWWWRIAVEKIVSAALRLGIMLCLLLTGQLNVLSAVLVLTVVPIVAGLVHLAALQPRRTVTDHERSATRPFLRDLLGYGSRSWVGAVAGILLAKLGVVLFIPLSNSTQLGLYAVGVTISDVPIVIALALREALFGVSTKERNAAQFASACRMAVALAVLGTAVLAATVPWWIGPVFGSEFVAAIPSTWLLMACSIANVPAFLLAAGLSAWGRPGLRSLGLSLTVVVDVVLFVALAPSYGAIGAAGANVVSSSFGAVFAVLMARRALGVRARDLLLTRGSDLRLVVALAKGIQGRFLHRSRHT